MANVEGLGDNIADLYPCAAAFGINDIYVSLKTFKKLSADRYDKNKEAGNLQTQVRWEFVQESCQACATGIFARDEFGREDKCLGSELIRVEELISSC